MKKHFRSETAAGGRRALRPMLAIAAGGVATSLTAGCGANLRSAESVAAPVTLAGTPMKGSVHGGQQPVAGATIQLYAVGSTGYASAATPLFTSTVTTAADGTFNSSAYTCPSAATQVYLTSTGGNSGFTTNANLTEMAALGNCGALNDSTFINISEVTTIGSVWALAPFMTDLKHVGSPTSNVAGLVNAFADVNVLVNTASGRAPGLQAPSGAVVPSAAINTLANAIAACVNSKGGTAGDGSSCGKLFTAATPSGGTAPTDTIAAAVNIAKNPASNVSAIYGLVSSTAPFAPTLSAAPNDFTLAVTFSGGGLNKPSSIALDSLGEAWIANSGGNTVTELSHQGATLSGTGFTGAMNAPSSIAIDLNDVVWVTNQGNNTVTQLSSSTGAPLSGSPLSGGGLSTPRSIALDSLGNAWIANSGNTSVTTINSNGSTLTNYAPSNMTGPVVIGVNPH